jgi:hypothetical protein
VNPDTKLVTQSYKYEFVISPFSVFTSVIVRHYVASWKVAGSIPDYLIGLLNLPNSSSSLWPPGSTQHLTKISTKDFNEVEKAPDA